ncbi:dethiobiotin synthase [Volucribacter amazonae]|uniref:ATP-dependent dethiobiotin synthetase BioD n=1 Tax=Volucribacter amazonae TaxID=256731 RepID=A0A9X4SIW0_9PAST|nr:dethiobiotin synthase [Volucribacter amazonae]MDG6896100.1 dethiobiotin synthase [Volucribacter amazonae]
MSANIVFISGIDTDIGKTIATGIYAKRLMQQGYSVITQKMIQTGCQGIAQDILCHRKIQGIGLTEEDKAGQTCGYVLDYPCSPHLAAEMQGIKIDTKKIAKQTALLAEKYDYVLIEGAGGLAVPYDEKHTSLDYLHQYGYPVILVTSGKLGSINHTLLSLMACQQYQIKVQTVIYNLYPNSDPLINQNSQQFIKNYLAQHHPDCEFMLLEQVDL